VGYSIVLVEWVHPTNSQVTYQECIECSQGFHSVWYSVLTLFKQLIAGDAWIMSFPVIDQKPWVAFFMFFIIISTVVGVMNLILTVIVERAAEARENDITDIVQRKAQNQHKTKKELMKLCREIDVNRNGILSADEMMAAYHNNADFRQILAAQDVAQCDMQEIIRMLDADGSGDLDYEEFCEQIIALMSQDARTVLALTRFSVEDTRNMLDKQLEQLMKKVELSQLTASHVLAQTSDYGKKIVSLDNKLDQLVLNLTLSDKSSPDIPIPMKLAEAGYSHINSMFHEVERLQHDLKVVHSFESELASQAEEQVQALLHEASNKATHALTDHDQCQPWNIDLSWACEAVRSSIAVLQHNVAIRLSTLMYDKQQKLGAKASGRDQCRDLLERKKQVLKNLSEQHAAWANHECRGNSY